MNTTLGGDALMRLLAQKMDYLNQRQAVISENIANASTPNYKARDLTPFSFSDALGQAGAGMKVTDPRHIIPASMAGVNAKSVKIKGEASLSGNTVDMEQEAMKVGQTAIDHQLSSTIYKHVAGWFRIALKGS